MEKQIAIAAPQITIKYVPNMKMSDRPKVTNAREGVELIRQYWDENFLEVREEARMILLTKAGRVLGIFTLSIGGTSQTVIDPAVVFLLAVRTPGAYGIILAHNHPSGSLQPSLADQKLTERIKAGADLVGLKLLDHYIIAQEGYLSMADEGMV